MMNYIWFCMLSLTVFSCSSQKKTIVPQPTVEVSSAPEKAKNIILLIGDGMGLSQISGGMYAMNNKTALEAFPVVGLQKTHAYDKLITDSAASATAIACGAKTYNEAIGVNADTVAVESILEEAEKKGMSTGLISTSTIVHATPASFIAHNEFRRNYEEIALDFLETEVDLFIGGGKKYFDRRSDERNLLEEFGSDYVISHFAEADLQSMAINPDKNFGYLTSDGDPLPYSQGRDYLIPAAEQAIKFLDTREKNGFFLMVEGSQIDWGGHANSTEYVLSEFQEYNTVIEKVLAYAKADGNTLVVVTADHETGGFAVQPESKLNDVKAAFTTGSHTGTMVPVFAYGPGAEAFAGIYDNTQIFHKMRAAFGWSPRNQN